MNTDIPSTALNTIDDLAGRAAGQADRAIDATKRATSGALSSMQDSVDSLRTAVPGAIGRAVAQVDDLTRRGMEKARETTAEVRSQVTHASDRTVDYIRDEPVKSVLIAAAAGASIAALIGLMSRSRTTVRS